jgi:ubiquinone/menaquinone biosynthesis C-methylase UbiE
LRAEESVGGEGENPAGAEFLEQPGEPDMKATKELIAGVFGRAAPTYERAGPRFFSEVARRLVALTDLPAGVRLLDVATGTGVALLEAAPLAGSADLVVGVDLAGPMVAEARRRLHEAGVANAAVLVMDAEALGFRAGSFDAVLCASALYLLPQPAAALRGFGRVLRPGGRLAVAVFGADLDERWSWRGELLARLAPPLEPLGRRLDQVSLRQALEEVGFHRVVVEVERLDVAYADAATWWASDWSHGERAVLELMSEPALAAYRQAAFQAIQRCREGDGALHWRPEVVFALATR